MIITSLATAGGFSAHDYRCDAPRGQPPITEWHPIASISYVRAGSFGLRARGQRVELVPGALMLGYPGDEYTCTHDHHAGGDACLSLRYAEELLDTFAGSSAVFRRVHIPPLPELMALGELAHAAATQRSELALDEVSTWLCARSIALATGRSPRGVAPSPSDRRRAVDAALFIEAEAASAGVPLDALARRARLTPFHFLRLFSNVVGASPHQYLIRCRLRRAARLLSEETLPVTAVAFESGFADLSNFVRSFHRATGVSPLRFRRLARGDRKILQERLALRGHC